MSNQDNFGSRLKKRMDEKGITMPALAKGLKPKKGGVLEGDLGRAAVYGWINGLGFPNVIQLAAICQKLDISADYLLFGAITQSSPKMEKAAQAVKDAVKELTDEERQALFAVIHGPALSDDQVEQHLPAPPPDPLHSDFGALEPFHPSQLATTKHKKKGAR